MNQKISKHNHGTKCKSEIVLKEDEKVNNNKKKTNQKNIKKTAKSMQPKGMTLSDKSENDSGHEEKGLVVRRNQQEMILKSTKKNSRKRKVKMRIYIMLRSAK